MIPEFIRGEFILTRMVTSQERAFATYMYYKFQDIYMHPGSMAMMALHFSLNSGQN